MLKSLTACQRSLLQCAMAVFGMPVIMLGGCSGGTVPPASPAASGAALRSSPAAAKTIDWPNFGFNSGHDAYNSKETTLGVGNIGSLQVQNNFNAGSGITESPLEIGSDAYFVAKGSGGESLFAVNEKTNKLRWSKVIDTDDDFNDGLAYSNGLVFATPCGTSGQTGICAFNAKTGAEAWSYLTNEGNETAPVTSNGVVYVGLYYSNSYGSIGAIDAFNATTGATLWSEGYCTNHEGNCSQVGGATPAVDGGKVYFDCEGAFFASADEYGVCAADLSSGTLAWAVNLNVFDNPAISAANGYVYAALETTPGTLYSLSEKSGVIRWSYDPGSGYSYPAAVTKDFVYLASSGSQVPQLAALHVATGKAVWHDSNYSDWSDSSPATANGVLYIERRYEGMAGYNAATGALLWSGGGGNYGVAGPIVLNGHLYGPCGSNSLCSYGLSAMK